MGVPPTSCPRRPVVTDAQIRILLDEVGDRLSGFGRDLAGRPSAERSKTQGHERRRQTPP